ncbi:MAG TPA: RDD family protein [Homoserinimonas sp.]|nr:RDD family protein [Homoserinimonas sp.]
MTSSPDVEGWVAPKAPVGPAPGLAYGGFWIRTLAYLIDATVLVGVMLGISYATGVEFAEVTSEEFRSGDFTSVRVFASPTPIAWLVMIGYFVPPWVLFGRTLGMAPFRLRIVRAADGSRLGLVRAVVRFFGLLLSFVVFFIGVIWVAADSKKQGWHDKLAGTVVVRPSPGTAASAVVAGGAAVDAARVDG